MTYPEDRVLVGVIKRKRDLVFAREDHWYRIPASRMTRGIQAEYLALFLSHAFGALNGGVHHYTRIQGTELVYRRWLLPDEAHHKRSGELYYKVALGELHQKIPPILNPRQRTFSFIYTTWDRFVHAQTIADLYSKADYFVERIYNAMQSNGLKPQRFWEAEGTSTRHAPGLSVLSADGPVYFSTTPGDDALYLDYTLAQDVILQRIRDEIDRHGGPVDMNAPLEGD